MTLPRPSIPMRTQRDAAIIQLGLDPATAELDHDPALGLRMRTEDGGYDPPANDPQYLKWRDPDGHGIKTHGMKSTTAGSDIHLIAKGKRLSRSHEEFRRRLLAKEPGQSARPKSKWAPGRKLQSRGFQQRRQP